MFVGLLIYVFGRDYLPPEPPRGVRRVVEEVDAPRDNRRVWLLLLGI